MKGRRKLMILLPLVAIGVVAGVLWYRSRLSDDPSTIRVSGNIEIKDVQTGFKIAGRMEQRPAREGQRVTAGEVIARLDDTDLVQEAAIRQAEVEAAAAILAELEAGSRQQEIAVARAAVRRAQADQDQQQRDYERHRQLHEQNVITTQTYEQVKLAYEVAATRLQEADEQLKLVEEGPRPEKIAQARARRAQAQRALELAQTRAGYATLAAPCSGVVLSEHLEPGEYAAPGTPIVTIGVMENVWLRAYINETDLGRVHLGQRVNVTTDSYPDKIYEGRVSFISSEAEFTPKNVQTTEERVKLVYRVKIDIPNPDLELKPGMPADATILLGQGAP